MEYLKGTYAEVFEANDKITNALGFSRDTDIKTYADITECIDGKHAIIIIPEVKKYLTASEISKLVCCIDVKQKLLGVEDDN